MEDTFYPVDFSNSIDISKDGKSVTLEAKQISTSTLGMIFSLKPETIWLQNSVSNRIFLPDDGGAFSGISKDSSVGCYGLVINGVPLSSTATVSSPSPTVAASSHDPPPFFKSVVSKRHGTVKLKIIAAHMSYSSNGKPQFQNQDSLFVDVDEASANATTLQKLVQEEFGGNYIIVSSDGLIIKDSPATRGKYTIMQFYLFGQSDSVVIKITVTVLLCMHYRCEILEDPQSKNLCC